MEVSRPNASNEIGGVIYQARIDLEHSKGLIIEIASKSPDPENRDKVTNNTLDMLVEHTENLRAVLGLAPLVTPEGLRILEIIIEKPNVFELMRKFATSHIRTREQFLIELKHLATDKVRASVNIPKEDPQPQTPEV